MIHPPSNPQGRRPNPNSRFNDEKQRLTSGLTEVAPGFPYGLEVDLRRFGAVKAFSKANLRHATTGFLADRLKQALLLIKPSLKTPTWITYPQPKTPNRDTLAHELMLLLLQSFAARLSAVLLPALLLLGLCACSDSPSEPDASGTKAMVRMLAGIDARTDPMKQSYANSLRARTIERQLKQSRGQNQVPLARALANELVLAGETRRGIEQYEKLNGLIPRADLELQLGIAHLRLGEQENCQQAHTSDSCLFPIANSGVHELPGGSRSARAHFAWLLENNPLDLTARWLDNVAAMTLGEWPTGVPEAWRMEPELFESEADLGRFHDRATDLGVDTMGLSGGISIEDFDGDGDLDLLVSAWGLSDPLRYFQNTGDGRFSELSTEVGLEGITGGLNMVHADCDNDGDVDVFVLRGAWLGYPPATDGGAYPNSLLVNVTAGGFVDDTEAAGLLSLHPTQTAAWGDLDGDGLLDLFVGNESHGANVHPAELFMNQGHRRFVDEATSRGADVRGMIKSVVLGDYDNDGDLDVHVSRLTESNLLLRNENGHFTDATSEAGLGAPTRSFPGWWFDYDNDGWQDLFVSGYGSDGKLGTAGTMAASFLKLPHNGETPRLFHNRGDGTFEDVSSAAGFDQVTFTMGSNFGDLDNDGWLDFYLGTGDPDYRSIVPNRMYRNAEGKRFQDVTTSGGFGHLQKGHAIAFADLDEDGDQDVFAVMGGAFEGDVFMNALFENPGHGNRWIKLELEGTRSNRSAIGARVAVQIASPSGERSVHSTVSTGGSFGSSPLRRELGLADATRVLDVQVTWPGTTEPVSYGSLELGRTWHIVEGESAPTERLAKPTPFNGTEGGHAEAHAGH
ncbi:MAG: hypothetical protein ACI8TQ_003507 [Planctomycetota bacterium]